MGTNIFKIWIENYPPERELQMIWIHLFQKKEMERGEGRSQLSGQWKVPFCGGLWKVPLLGGPWKVPLLGGFWKENKKHLFPLSPNNFYLNLQFFPLILMSQPYFGQVWGWSPTLGKSEDLESSGTPECSELNSKPQNTLHWGVLGVIGKVLKRRYRKWPRIAHLNICSPSYGQKKGRESNWQFDSRPLKVGNRPLPDLRLESAISRCKDLDEGYKFGLDLVVIRLCSRELWAPKVPGQFSGQFRDSDSRVPGVPGKSDIQAWVPQSVTKYNIGSMVVAYSRVRAVVSQVNQSARGLSQHPRVSRNVN